MERSRKFVDPKGGATTSHPNKDHIEAFMDVGNRVAGSQILMLQRTAITKTQEVGHVTSNLNSLPIL